MRSQCFAILILLALVPAILSAADAPAKNPSVDDAKRKLATQMVAEAHYKEAEAILKEVIADDNKQYKDHLALAQVYEKLQDPANALLEYRTVAELLPEHPTDRDAAKARIAVDKRLKVLDAESGKINDLVADFSKKLDALQREAAQQHNVQLIQKICSLKAGLWRAEKPANAEVVEISASTPSWTGTNFKLISGHNYRVSAMGVWRIGPGVDCSPDGIAEKTNGWGPIGCLVLNQGGSTVTIGSKAEFTAARDCTAAFLCNIAYMDTKAGRENASGTIYVMIEPL